MSDKKTEKDPKDVALGLIKEWLKEETGLMRAILQNGVLTGTAVPVAVWYTLVKRKVANLGVLALERLVISSFGQGDDIFYPSSVLSGMLAAGLVSWVPSVLDPLLTVTSPRKVADLVGNAGPGGEVVLGEPLGGSTAHVGVDMGEASGDKTAVTAAKEGEVVYSGDFVGLVSLLENGGISLSAGDLSRLLDDVLSDGSDRELAERVAALLITEQAVWVGKVSRIWHGTGEPGGFDGISHFLMNDHSKSWYELAREFNGRVHTLPDKPTILDEPERSRQYIMMLEELEEFVVADTAVSQARELLDVIYVALGALCEMGVDPDPLFRIIHEANMLKVQNPTQDDNGKVQKPTDWEDPKDRLEAEIRRQGVSNG